ncbi:hypothetical protein Tco_1220968 [Tanacetum coccineum]
MMAVKVIFGRLLEEEEKLEWWFEQDIDREEKRFQGDEYGGELEDIGRRVKIQKKRKRCFETERKDWNEKIHHHFHQWNHPMDEMRMDDLEWLVMDLQSLTIRLEEMRIKRRDSEQWMHHMLLPHDLRQHVVVLPFLLVAFLMLGRTGVVNKGQNSRLGQRVKNFENIDAKQCSVLLA